MSIVVGEAWIAGIEIGELRGQAFCFLDVLVALFWGEGAAILLHVVQDPFLGLDVHVPSFSKVWQNVAFHAICSASQRASKNVVEVAFFGD